MSMKGKFRGAPSAVIVGAVLVAVGACASSSDLAAETVATHAAEGAAGSVRPATAIEFGYPDSGGTPTGTPAVNVAGGAS